LPLDWADFWEEAYYTYKYCKIVCTVVDRKASKSIMSKNLGFPEMAKKNTSLGFDFPNYQRDNMIYRDSKG